MNRSRLDRVMLNFSGGYDSLATAVILAPCVEQLDLVTFRLLNEKAIFLAKRNVDKLKSEFPDTRIIHSVVDARDAQRELLAGFSQAVEGFSAAWAPMGLWCCTCHLAMRTASILYCVRKNIRYCADGAARKEYHHSSHKISVINQMKDLFSEYGIEYLNPVYDFPGWVKDFLRGRGYKVGIEVFSMKTTQTFCWVSFFSNIRQQSSPSATPENVVAVYVRGMIPRVRALIDRKLREKGFPAEGLRGMSPVQIDYVGGEAPWTGVSGTQKALSRILNVLFWPVYKVFNAVVTKRFR